MTPLPREFLDNLAAFAAGVKPQDEWGRWFAMHAYRLSRLLDRTQMRQLKRVPREAVSELLAAAGVTIDTTQPAVDEGPEQPLLAEEYAVFTRVLAEADSK